MAWKLATIGRVMTSLIVITFRIGQSVGKASKSVMTRIGCSFNDASCRGPHTGLANGMRIARVLVHNDGLVGLSGLKEQSGPW